jgi:hypothetical protein
MGNLDDFVGSAEIAGAQRASAEIADVGVTIRIVSPIVNVCILLHVFDGSDVCV